MLTLNSQQKYHTYKTQLQNTQHILIINNNLINNKLTINFYHTNKTITLINNTTNILTSLIPPKINNHLQHQLTKINIHLLLKSQLQKLKKTNSNILTTLNHQHNIKINTIITTTKLHPKTTLTQHTKLTINHNIYINNYLQTNNTNIYTLNNYTKINNQILPFLQPIQLNTIILTKNLLNNNTPLKLPTILIKIKTPKLPLHLTNKTQHQNLH